ncbi:MAG: trypsin-like peptidase domain-containing protein [Opitutaceae bacterium]|nr:trypsin-like peptidase domain-containing protein [Opitutaceae bacterium]
MKSTPRFSTAFSCLLLAAAFAIPGIVSRAAAADAGAANPEPTVKPNLPVSAATTSTPVENSVVKVFSTMRYPDLAKPWTKQAPTEVSGTGMIIEGKRILTNAHVVRYASQVQVQPNQSGDKISATVEAIAYGIDLAVLKLDDESLFDTRPPLTRASTVPDVKDTVMAYGYPTGGTSLSITKGIVSRIEFASYTYPVSGLLIQIDAAINPGNSGGPAMVGDKVIGLAFSILGRTQNIGYIIPCEEIEVFLRDVADHKYDGKPAMFDELQTFQNPALHPFLKLDHSVEGMVVHTPDSTDPAYPLKEWDLITKIGDTRVDNEGMIKLSANLRIRFQYLIPKVAKDGKAPLTVVRGGKEILVDLPVSPTRPRLIDNLQGAYPAYFIYGPIVFSPATEEIIAAMTTGTNGPSVTNRLTIYGNPLMSRRGDKTAFEGEQLVVVPSPFFPHKLSKGYSSPAGHVVKSINGIAIKNLRHLVEVLRDATDEFVTIKFAGRASGTLVFPRKEMVAATDEILTDNGVRSQGSDDMLAIWRAKPAQ